MMTTTLDDEIEAMRAMYDLMRPFSVGVQERCFEWLKNRLRSDRIAQDLERKSARRRRRLSLLTGSGFGEVEDENGNMDCDP